MVHEWLQQGRENAITSALLVQLTGCRSARRLRAQIALERAQGRPILSCCSGNGGYYLPADGPQGQREIAEFHRTLSARAKQTYAALHGVERALSDLDGQQQIGEGAD